MIKKANEYQWVITDIEGTTSSISFVKDVLFPYAYARLEEFLHANLDNRRVHAALELVVETLEDEGESLPPTDQQIVAALQRWMDEDRKHQGLKLLQGMIWQTGYEDGTLLAHCYAEVPDCLRAWHADGVKLAVYSSGSIAAQRLFFTYTEFGDISELFDSHFDTGIGAKQESESYLGIIQALDVAASDILFLSDIAAELEAASAAGIDVLQVVRAADGTVADDRFTHIDSFLTLS